MVKPPDIAATLAAIKNSLSPSADTDAETHAREFPIGSRIHRAREREQKRHRRRLRRVIRADNARDLVRAFPSAPGDSTHALIPGDFEFCNILTTMAEEIGPPDAVHLTSLSVSKDNCVELERLLRAHPDCHWTLALSYFFKSTNKTIFAALEHKLCALPNFRLALGRLHTKIILWHVPSRGPDKPERHLVIETSANLRACRNLEQVTVFECAELHAFHLEWISEFHRLAEAGGYEHVVSFTGEAARRREFNPAPADA